MKLYFKVPPEADGMLLRGFLRKCSVSTDLSRACLLYTSPSPRDS